jgi:hypothetical protein
MARLPRYYPHLSAGVDGRRGAKSLILAAYRSKSNRRLRPMVIGTSIMTRNLLDDPTIDR